MNTDQFDPVMREQAQHREIRAAVDVMFEALAHIQASMETKSEEKRQRSYRKFKEALYERFEHVIEKRDRDACGAMGGMPEGQAEEESEGDDAEDTIQKLWPTIAKTR